MQRIRFGLTLAMLAVCLFVATPPAFAASTVNVPTTIGIAVIGLAFIFIQWRNRAAGEAG